MSKPAILALDQGTTSSRAILFDNKARAVATFQKEFPQIYPDNGWVEHDPEDIWKTTRWAAKRAITEAKKHGLEVKAIGITNQRETTLVWDRETLEPIYNAIVWQDRRTANVCERLKKKGHEAEVSKKTGLLLDPYFSATKAAWILGEAKGAKARARKGELAFGTVDSFLIAKLTNGASHVTDVTNASRTNLYNIKSQKWDEELATLFGVPMAILPEVKECADEFGVTSKKVLGIEVPILGVAGDQQAALIGQGCFTPGEMKSTYGTGCFAILHTGDKMVRTKNRLLSTIGYRIDGKTAYALEGSLFVAGAAIKWLRDELGLIKHAGDTEELAKSVDDSGGVYVVPAFTGLGAPHWDPHARGAILGLTRGAGKAHIVRATLEGIAYQTAELLTAMKKDGGKPELLNVDGGMVGNSWFCEALADMTGMTVNRPVFQETTALGAAWLAGYKAGIYPDFETLAKSWKKPSRFEPRMSDADRRKAMKGWLKAVERVKG